MRKKVQIASEASNSRHIKKHVLILYTVYKNNAGAITQLPSSVVLT